MKPWEAFYPFILSEVPGCPDPVINFALVRAVRDFCKATKAWTVWADPLKANGRVQRFEFDLPMKTELLGVKRATVGGTDVSVLSSAHLPADWASADTTYPEDALIQISASEYMLYPKPTAGTAVLLEMVLRPTLDATGVDDGLLAEHGELISKRALYLLMSSQNKPYTNVGGAVLARTEYDAGISFAANSDFLRTAPKDRRVKKPVL